MDLFALKVAKYSPRLQKDVGVKGFQADGVFGNLGEESAGFTQLHQKDGNGLGWAQWDDRRHNFELFATSKGLSVEDDEANYGFLVHELLGTENPALQALKATRTRDDATRVFMEKFERPGVPALDVRIHWAIRAETARLQQEATMVDTPPVVTPAVVTDNKAQQVDVLAQWIKEYEATFETVIRSFAVARGIPGFAVDLAFQVVNPMIDQAVANIHVEDLGKLLVEHVITPLLANLNKK